jgi:hypothetical protein
MIKWLKILLLNLLLTILVEPFCILAPLTVVVWYLLAGINGLEFALIIIPLARYFTHKIHRDAEYYRCVRVLETFIKQVKNT